MVRIFFPMGSRDISYYAERGKAKLLQWKGTHRKYHTHHRTHDSQTMRINKTIGNEWPHGPWPYCTSFLQVSLPLPLLSSPGCLLFPLFGKPRSRREGRCSFRRIAEVLIKALATSLATSMHFLFVSISLKHIGIESKKC